MAETLDVEETAPNLGNVIKQRLADTVKNIDVVSMLTKMVATTPEDEESTEIRDKLKGILQKYNDMSEEEKEQFTSQMKEILANRVAMKLNNQNLNLEGLQEQIGEAIMFRLVLLGIGALLLILVFVFFGYKLYKSIKEKELRKEEKRKAKMMKKKK